MLFLELSKIICIVFLNKQNDQDELVEQIKLPKEQ